MKSLKAFALLFVLTALPVSAELVTDPVTGLRTGTITVNGETYRISPLARLPDANLRGADLTDANLQGAFLGGANLSVAGLGGANLSGAHLTHANLSGAGLYDTNFTNADLRDADLEFAMLAGANFTNADLSGVRSGSHIGAPTALPDDWNVVYGSLPRFYLFGPHVDLSYLWVVTSLPSSGFSLRGANLTGTRISNLNLSGIDLRDANLNRATLSGINLSEANLGGANLRDADLRVANLSDANLIDADLRDANLRDADLQGAFLRNANLRGAILEGANLTGANLTGVRSGLIIGIPSDLPAGWRLIFGTLIGPAISKDEIIDIFGAQLAEVTAERDAAITERDARPTLAEVQDARVDSIVMAKDPVTGVVTLCFDLQKTDDFISWIAYGGGTLNDLGDGQFKVSLPLGPGKEWLRMVMKK